MIYTKISLKSESKLIPLQGKKCNNAANTLHYDNITRQIPTDTHKPEKRAQNVLIDEVIEFKLPVAKRYPGTCGEQFCCGF